MPAEMTVIRRVPIGEVGTWAASTGEWKATRKQFEDAVAACKSMAIRLPRIYIDSDPHPEERISGRNPDHGLSVGWADNLAINRDLLLADFHVPPLLAETMHAHFPSRSLEGRNGVVAANGQRYEFVVDGIQLLSTHLPAVETLEDIAELWGMTPPREPVAASSETSGSRLIVCALTGGAASPASAGPDNPRQEAPMPTPAPAEEPKTPAEPKAEEPKGTEQQPKGEPATPKAEQPKADPKPVTLDDLPDHLVVVDKSKIAEYDAGMKQLERLLKKAADDEADAFADELVDEGVIAASSKEQYANDHRVNPELTRRICSRMPKGVHQPPPVGRVAATRGAETDADDGGSGFSTRLLNADQIADAKARGLIKED